MKTSITSKIVLIISLLGIQSSLLQAFSTPEFLNKHSKAIVSATLAALSTISFKQFCNLQAQRDSLFRSVLPNFDQIMIQMQPEFIHYNSAQPNNAAIWEKFYDTHIKPTKPELMPQIRSLDLKSGLLFGTGFFLATISFCLFCDYLFPMKKTNKENKDLLSLR